MENFEEKANLIYTIIFKGLSFATIEQLKQVIVLLTMLNILEEKETK